MSLSSLLNTSISCQRPLQGKDTSGGSTRNFQPVPGLPSSIPATIQPLSDMERQKWASREVFLTHVIYLDQNLALKKQDRVTDSTGTIYVVHSFQDEGGRGEVFSIHVHEQT